MTIEELDRLIARKHATASNPWGLEERTLHIVEEVGELFEILLHLRGAKQPPKTQRDVAVALADVIEDVAAIARGHGLSLQDVANEAAKAD